MMRTVQGLTMRSKDGLETHPCSNQKQSLACGSPDFSRIQGTLPDLYAAHCSQKPCIIVPQVAPDIDHKLNHGDGTPALNYGSGPHVRERTWHPKQ